MTSFQLSLTPTRRSAGRVVARIRRALQQALAEENARCGLTQAEVARKIGVHRSVINRELNGTKDITIGRIGELASALGRSVKFELVPLASNSGSNDSGDGLSVATGASTFTVEGFSAARFQPIAGTAAVDPPTVTRESKAA